MHVRAVLPLLFFLVGCGNTVIVASSAGTGSGGSGGSSTSGNGSSGKGTGTGKPSGVNAVAGGMSTASGPISNHGCINVQPVDHSKPNPCLEASNICHFAVGDQGSSTYQICEQACDSAHPCPAALICSASLCGFPCSGNCPAHTACNAMKQTCDPL